MTVIICVDDLWGMAFGGRRVSRDRVVTEKIKERCKNSRLLISPYSLSLFEGFQNAEVFDDFLIRADGDDVCFAEVSDPSEVISRADEVIIYKWNRRYPSDLKFTCDVESLGFELFEKNEFSGNSHEKITEEVFRKNTAKN